MKDRKKHRFLLPHDTGDIPGTECFAQQFPTQPHPVLSYTFTGTCQPASESCGPPGQKTVMASADCKPTCGGGGSGPNPNPDVRNVCCVDATRAKAIYIVQTPDGILDGGD